MATLDLSAREARRRLTENASARWSSGWEREPGPGTAWQRLQRPLFAPTVSAGFTISRSDSIFAVGSCFARGVEGRLVEMGFNVTSRTSSFERFEVQGNGWPHAFANKYNPLAILNELRWALDPSESFPPEGIIEVAPGEWHDPHAHPIFGRASRETTLEQHAILTRLVAQIPSCRVVVITLGLIEAWFDQVLGVYTNSTPWLDGPSLERFRFRVLEYREVIDALHAIHNVLSTFGHPELKILVTVSLVPLDATFSGDDFVIANAHSKSLLRTAAVEWAAAHENVHYFPSYEIAMNSDRATTWHIDGRHVRVEAIDHILGTFIRAYVGDEKRAGVGAREPELAPRA